MAAASKARREQETAERLKKNAEMKRRLQNVEARLDDELDTEAAALARAEFAAKSEARREAEAIAQRRHKQEMERRIRETASRTDVEMDTEVAATARAA